MKKGLLILASLLIVLGMVTYSLSYSQAYVTSPFSLKIVPAEYALISLSASPTFEAAAPPETDVQKSEPSVASPTDLTAANGEEAPMAGLSEASAAESGMDETPVPVAICGKLFITNNMEEAITISSLFVQANDIGCISESNLYLAAGESIALDAKFEGNPAAAWALTGSLLCSWENGQAEIEINLPISVTVPEASKTLSGQQVPSAQPVETNNPIKGTDDPPQAGSPAGTPALPDENGQPPESIEPVVSPSESESPQATPEPTETILEDAPSQGN